MSIQHTKATRMDKRHSGHQQFKWYISQQRTASGSWNEFLREFAKRRQWCWATYGAGCDRDEAWGMDPVPTWAWLSNDQKGYRFYFAKDEQLQWFLLKFG